MLSMFPTVAFTQTTLSYANALQFGHGFGVPIASGTGKGGEMDLIIGATLGAVFAGLFVMAVILSLLGGRDG